MTSPIIEQKKTWRTSHRARLRAMGEAERAQRSAALRAVLAEAPALRSAGAVACFAPMPEEPELWPLFEAWWEEGRALAFPVVKSQRRELTFHVVSAREELIFSTARLWEPDPARHPEVSGTDLHAVLTPGLAFGRDGTRLGRGKAYYDSWFATLPGSVWRVGLAWAWQVHDAVPHESHDERLDAIATDEGWVDCVR